MKEHDHTPIEIHPITLLITRGEGTEICKKLHWLYMNSGMMRQAIEHMKFAYEHDVAELERNGIKFDENTYDPHYEYDQHYQGY